MKKDNGVLNGVSNIDLMTLKFFPKRFWKGVTAIGERAFRKTFLMKITIPEGVTHIERGAFSACSELEEVNLPQSLTNISNEAFIACNSLKSIVIPDGVSVINDDTFYGCSKLTSIVLPQSLKEIKQRSFSGCKKLKDIQFPKLLKLIDSNAFVKCAELTNIEIPENVTINDMAFQDCIINKVTVPQSVVYKGSSFKECKINEVEVGDFKAGAFGGCRINKVIIQEGAKTISKGGFFKNGSIQEVELPNSVETIDDGVFTECSKLSKINLPQNLRKIGDKAFYRCELLPFIEIPEGVKSIGATAFGSCYSLYEITIPKSVKNIGMNFCSGAGIKKATILADIDSLPAYAFNNCAELEEVSLPNSMSVISLEAFDGCEKLTKINFPEKLMRIGSTAFKNTGLTEIDLPDNVALISGSAFESCKQLTRVKLSKQLRSIPKDCFKDCVNLKEVELPNNVQQIYRGAFSGCKNLTYMKLSGRTFVENNAFYDSGIKFVTITEKDVIYSKDKQHIKKSLTISYDLFDVLKENDILRDVLESGLFKTFESEMKPFEKDIDETSAYERQGFYNFAVALGCFSQEHTRDGKGNLLEATKAQKRSSLLASFLKSGALSIHDINLDYTSIGHFSDDAVKFIATQNGKEYPNIELLKRLEEEYNGITEKVLREFDLVKASRVVLDENGIPKKQSWRDTIVKYYTSKKYANITQENQDIAEVFARHNLTENSFDRATRIRQDAEKNNIPSHILGKNLKELTILEQIEQLQGQTSEMLGDSKTLIDKLYNKKFTFEFLDKRDPKNFILGIYASCCATIMSSAYGSYIAGASVTAKDVQNLVIRDTNGEVIAKGTIYVNEESGYAVINDFEVNEKFRKDETDSGRYSSKPKSQASVDRELIFQAFKRGVDAFVKEYDAQHPNNPIQKINVGMGFNRLKEQCERYKKEKKLLSVPSNYSFADAEHTQHILYERENDNNEAKQK